MPYNHHIKNITGKILVPVCAVLCMLPFVTASIALLLGIFIALLFGNPYIARTRKLTSQCLAVAVVGLGAGMDLNIVGRVGAHGIVYTMVSIALACTGGTLLGRVLKVTRDTSLLITVGTAICGGSAIAAIAPVIRAKEHEISVSLSIVFLLNALALVIFPMIGHAIGLTQTQFGLWAALAIHDTSSVVGATLQYGPQALQTGTTIKLARALWIIPLAFLIGFYRARQPPSETAHPNANHDTNQNTPHKPKRPWFIIGFLLAAALVTYIPVLQPAGHIVETLAKRLLVVTLFLIGTGLTRQTLKNVGYAPFLQGIALWVLMAGVTFILIYKNVMT